MLNGAVADLIPCGTWRAASGGGTLSADIVAQIRDQLFAGQLKPGDYLGSEASLAQAFDVSRMAMRDALRALSATGVIQVRRGAGGGIRIAAAELGRFADALAIQLTLLGVSRGDLIEAQIATEAMITHLAAERASALDVEHLRAMLTRAAEAGSVGSAFARSLGEFHTELARIARNIALAVVLRGILHLLETSYGTDTTPARARRARQISYRCGRHRRPRRRRRGDADARASGRRPQPRPIDRTARCKNTYD